MTTLVQDAIRATARLDGTTIDADWDAAVLPPGHTGRVLVLCDHVPAPPRAGGHPRSWGIIRQLGRRAEVLLACRAEGPLTAEQRHTLCGVSERFAAVAPNWRQRAIAAAGVGDAVVDGELAARVRKWRSLAGGGFDAVLTLGVSMLTVAAEAIGHTRMLHVLDLEDSAAERADRLANDLPPALRWWTRRRAAKYIRLEAGEAVRVDAVTLPSVAAAQRYRFRVGDEISVRVLPDGVEMHHHPPVADRGQSVIGVWLGDDPAGRLDDTVWLGECVLPAVRQRCPGAELHAYAPRATRGLSALASIEGVKVHRCGGDPQLAVAGCGVFAVPWEAGRGLAAEALAAMAAGRAVTVSHRAAEGLDALHRRHLMIAATDADWVELLARLLRHPAARQQIGSAARRRVLRKHTWPRAAEPLLALLQLHEIAAAA